MRTRGLQITSLLVASPVVLILFSLIIILLVSICSQLRIWISALAASIGFTTKSTASKVLISPPSYHGMATNQFASLDSKTIASVDKISLSAPGSSSAWMHRLGQYLRMMPLRFAASSTILLAIIVLICIFAFRLARYKIRGQDAYETCMEKLAEYRIPGTMYINTKKFHEFLKAAERQPPTVRRWQLSKESSSNLSENSPNSNTALPTHNQPVDHSMLRVHRTGLTRPRSRSNGSSTPHNVPVQHVKETYEQPRRSDLDEKSASRNNSITSPFLSEYRKQNGDMRCNQSIAQDRPESNLTTAVDTDVENKIVSSAGKSSQPTLGKASVTTDTTSTTNHSHSKVDVSTTPDSSSQVEEDDSQIAFVQVERKKRKKTKATTKQSKPQQLPPRVEFHEPVKSTVDHVMEYNPEFEPVTDSHSQPEEASEEPLIVEDNSEKDTSPSQEPVEEPKLNLPTVPCSTTPSQPNQMHSGAWYSPFSSGLQLDILPRPQSPPEAAAYNSAPSYGQFGGIPINHHTLWYGETTMAWY
ncbi:hypothetical protein K450DRAFT_236565 [Umbelopsis ramanniana AG]|uniref:Uncharacterized protein n=1 Tax=Umbelopsis ramanniana AG TaxID=1314678 RepID=A0AAD5HG36_UMBRA|nr:uncharacterized protein K450DRAFT_236565 [Umbelopsis ramanniana AG]KAI8580638.1 hypothetical protein K450DRAFT_236565 [Umbelopsis ramanniana AG]